MDFLRFVLMLVVAVVATIITFVLICHMGIVGVVVGPFIMYGVWYWVSKIW